MVNSVNQLMIGRGLIYTPLLHGEKAKSNKISGCAPIPHAMLDSYIETFMISESIKTTKLKLQQHSADAFNSDIIKTTQTRFQQQKAINEQIQELTKAVRQR